MTPKFISSQEEPLKTGGIMDIPTDPGAMLGFGAVWVDPLHLCFKGYYYVAKHIMDQRLKTWLDEEIVRQKKD